MERSLILVIGPPRSGSTLLMRMLSSHSAIYSRAEPHLLTPLAHLGFYDTVDAAPFDHLQAQQSVREFVADLPRGEADYLDACRAYTDVLYGRMLAARGKGKPFFLDKTPANALVLPFIAKLYPRARYVVLTRHPGRDLELVRQLVLRRRLRRRPEVQSDPQPLRPGDGALHARRARADRARRLRDAGAASRGRDAPGVRVPRRAVRGGHHRLRQARARVEGPR